MGQKACATDCREHTQDRLQRLWIQVIIMS